MWKDDVVKCEDASTTFQVIRRTKQLLGICEVGKTVALLHCYSYMADRKSLTARSSNIL